ncbi:MAG: hypothetical protein K5662_06470 [Lachnospiraceae bacterium]|nr:hypothetical protein [Lachnospiraceae bacterium]
MKTKILASLLSVIMVFTSADMTVFATSDIVGSDGMTYEEAEAATIGESDVAIPDGSDVVTDAGSSGGDDFDNISGSVSYAPASVGEVAIGSIKDREIYSEYVEYVYPEYRDLDVTFPAADEVKSNSLRTLSMADSSALTVEQAALVLKNALMERQSSCSVTTVTQDVNALLDKAMEETESPKEGDYIRSNLIGWSGSISGIQGSDVRTITLSFTYTDSAEQEVLVDDKVEEIVATYDLAGTTLSDADKIKVIHDYLVDNIVYQSAPDEDGSYLRHSSYAALIKGSCVCQGYASAFYRLCREAGLSVRYVVGKGNGGDHAWNIVRIGDKYYNIDVTWDDPTGGWRIYYSYYLQNESDFEDHVRDGEYTTSDFNSLHPMAASSYSGAPIEKNNVSYSIPGVRGQNVSTGSSSKPRLIVLYSATGAEDVRSALQTYENEAWNTGDKIDVIAVECSGASSSTVSTFAASVDPAQIMDFSYCDSSSGSTVLNRYSSITGLPATVPMYILTDDSNYVMYAGKTAFDNDYIYGRYAYYLGLTPAPTPTPKPTVGVTPTPTPKPTVGVTPTPTPKPTVGVTPTPTAEVTPAPTAEVTPVPTVEVSPTPTAEVTPTPTAKVTPSPTVEVTPTPAPTEEVLPTPTAEVTPAPTEEVTPNPTAEVTPAPTEEVSPTPTVEVTPTPTPVKNPVNLSKCKITGIKNGTYNGSPIEQAGLKITYKNIKLVKDKDYTVEYLDNINAGTAKIVINGIGDYCGTVVKLYKIAGIAISKASVKEGLAPLTYTGNRLTPKLTLVYKTKTNNVQPLIEYAPVGNPAYGYPGTTANYAEADFMVEYGANTLAGTGKVVITGLKGYTGKVTKTFKINKAPVTGGDINVVYDDTHPVEYRKGGAKPAITVKRTVGAADILLEEGKDYTIAYYNNKSVNMGEKPTVVPGFAIKGKGNYSGTTFKRTYLICSTDIASTLITVSDVMYKNRAGNFISKPVITDTDGKVLKAGTDYDLKKARYYLAEDAAVIRKKGESPTELHAGDEVFKTDTILINESNAAVKGNGVSIRICVAGCKNYIGHQECEYRLISKNIASAKLAKSITKEYKGEAVTLTVDEIILMDGKTQISTDDYEIVPGSYRNNNKKGTASVTVRGINGYGGTKKITFKIVSR